MNEPTAYPYETRLNNSMMHRTRATERTVILMVENAGIVPTGS